MKAGLLDTVVTIQAKASAHDSSYGSEVASYSDFAQVWANILDASGREYTALRQMNVQVFTTITIRWLDGIKANMRVVVKNTGKIYQIISPPLERGHRHQWLELKCEAVNG